VLDHSAFSTASLESYADLLVSTGALLAKEGDDQNPIRWKSAPPWALAIEEGPAAGSTTSSGARNSRPGSCRGTGRGALAERSPQDRAARPTPSRCAGQLLRPGARRLAHGVQCCSGGDAKPVVWDSARDRTNPWIVFRYWTTPGDPGAAAR
jgi:hypothetical protein